MAGNATVGALRVVLGLDSAQFESGIKQAQKELGRAAAQFKRIGSELSSIGGRMSVAITAPILGLGAASLKAAANFETAMNRVGIATQASATEMAKLEAQAREIGKSTVFSAGEAATAMELLAKTGVSTTDILGGAAKATVDLAAATGSELDPAASAVADTMAQFSKSASDLPAVVNQITGAVNESKLDFADYQLAMGMAGGVAGSLGVTLQDFNATLAGTSPLFSSGSDAGTSFKTFLTKLIPTTKEAETAIDTLGLKFFNADGSMRGMSEIAEELRTKLGGLNDEAKNQVLKDIFGTDAMRTAIGLMNLGADGLDNIKQKIGETNAAAQAAERMKGLAGQIEQLKGALEELGIAIGKSGLLSAMTSVVAVLGGLVDVISGLPAPILQVVTGFAAVAAVMGPLIYVGGQMMVVWGSLLTLGGMLTPVWLAVGGSLLKVAGSATIAGAAARGLGLAMSFIMGPWGVAILAIAGAMWALHAADEANIRKLRELEAANKAANKAMAETAQWSNAAAAGADGLGDDAAGATSGVAALTGEVDKLTDANYRLAASIKAAELAKLMKGAGDAFDERSRVARERDAAKARAQREGNTNVALAARSSTAMQAAQGRAQQRVQEAVAPYDRLLRDADGRLAEYATRINSVMNARLDDPRFRTANANGGSGAGDGADKKGGKAREGLTADEIQRRVEQLRREADLEAARLSGDVARTRELEKQADLADRTAAYVQAGLKDVAAEDAAKKDIAVIDAAKAKAQETALRDHAAELELTEAQISADYARVDALERTAEEARLIAFYQAQGKDIEIAQKMAAAELLKIDEARAKVKARLVAQAKLEHDLELARLRGDSEASIRTKERALEIERRAGQIAERDRIDLEPARDKARLELDQEDEARLQGQFRSVFKEGFRAALDGDLENFAKNWLIDWASRGLEEALNNVADLLYSIFKEAMSAMGRGGTGGWEAGLGAIGDMLPGFNNGADFIVPGSGGIDSQITAFRSTPRERVQVTPKNARTGNGGSPVIFDLRGAVMTQDLLDQMNVISRRHAAGAVAQSTSIARKSAPSAQASLAMLGTP